jgi:hypothetical protein
MIIQDNIRNTIIERKKHRGNIRCRKNYIAILSGLAMCREEKTLKRTIKVGSHTR